MSADEELLADLADLLRSRFYGKYRGTVTQVDSGTLQIKAKVPAVLGETETGWCLPCVPYAGPNVGLFLVPDPGAAVWIEFEGGDVSLPIWAGCLWRSGELPSDAAPKVRGLVTGAPHKLLFDDDQSTVDLEDAGGDSLTFDGSGITASSGSSSVNVNSASVSVNNGALEVQ